MDAVLSLLAEITPATAKAAAELLAPELLAASSAQQKHKLKTRISALLKSSGTTRALGAVLARRALVDWSIVKSHGATWAPILLHVLELPDRVCWAPAVKTLTFLYTQVHGKADLARETGGAKIGEFLKRLLKLLPQTGSSLFFAVTRMLQLYPTQCRPYLNKLAPVLGVPGGERALACLTLAEKAGAEAWQQRFGELLAQLEKSSGDAGADDILRAQQLAQLREYTLVAGRVRAKIPAARLLRVVNALLKTFKPLATAQVLDFMRATRGPLETLYIQSFDLLVYSLVDCVDLGKRLAVAVADFMAWELRSVGWASESYAQVLTRLTKKLLAVAHKQHESTGAEGLADYVQNPGAFKRASFSPCDTAALARYFTAVALCVPTIPQSLRTQIDYYLLANGTVDEVVKATLYAGRFSILPLTIHERLPTLEGLETLVHPRFPPLNISQHALQMAHNQQEEAAAEHEAPAAGDVEAQAGAAAAEITIDAANDVNENAPAEMIEAEETPLPSIPESVKPVHRPVLEAPPPEKRLRLSDPEDAAPPRAEPVAVAETVAEPATQISTTVNLDAGAEPSDADSEDELVIPALTMDSD